MLTRTQFYIVNTMVWIAGAGLVILGGFVVDTLGLPPLASRILNWLVVGIALTFCGGGMTYVSYRREIGDSTVPPLPPTRDRLAPITRILALVLCLMCLLVAPLMAYGAFESRDWEWLAGSGGMLLGAFVFGYAGAVGKDPTVALLARLNS